MINRINELLNIQVCTRYKQILGYHKNKFYAKCLDMQYHGFIRRKVKQ